MGQTLPILLLLILLALPSLGQKHQDLGLILGGSVVGIGAQCINRKTVPYVAVYFQFRNDGNETLLFIPPTLWSDRALIYPGKSGESLRAPSYRYNYYLSNPFGTATKDDYDPIPRYASGLDQPEPPDFVVTLKPGTYYEFRDIFWTETGFKFELGNDELTGGCKKPKKTPTLEHQTFRVDYRFSFKKYGDILDRLRSRWKSFGHLIPDDDGEITYRSEEIIFDTGN